MKLMLRLDFILCFLCFFVAKNVDSDLLSCRVEYQHCEGIPSE